MATFLVLLVLLMIRYVVWVNVESNAATSHLGVNYRTLDDINLAMH
jgi:uncharacterized protein (DUF1499 family)